jgi:hypothetical protein
MGCLPLVARNAALVPLVARNAALVPPMAISGTRSEFCVEEAGGSTEDAGAWSPPGRG